jgi:hypothetical protein
MKVEAYFRGIKSANEAVDKLKSQGINAYSDLNDHYQVNTDIRTKEVGPLSSPSNSDLVLNSGTPSGSTGKSPLLAASPMVSGMGGFEEIADVNYKVIITVDSEKEAAAKSIIEAMGGSMQSPNLEVPKHLKDVDISKADPDFINGLE